MKHTDRKFEVYRSDYTNSLHLVRICRSGKYPLGFHNPADINLDSLLSESQKLDLEKGLDVVVSFYGNYVHIWPTAKGNIVAQAV